MSSSSNCEVMVTITFLCESVPNFDDTLEEVFWGEVTEKERLIVENDAKQLMIASSRANESLDDIKEVDVERDSSLVWNAVFFLTAVISDYISDFIICFIFSQTILTQFTNS